MRRFGLRRQQAQQPAQLPPESLHIKLIDCPVHQQRQSPLFHILPPEVRNHLFSLSFFAFIDPSKGAYPEDTHYTRPGYTHPKSIPISFLQTCRKIYLEARLLPVALNEHVFWMGRGPLHFPYPRPKERFQLMTTEQHAQITEVHLFIQQYNLENSTGALWGLSSGGCVPNLRKIVITLRRGDWWNWEQGNEMAIEPRTTQSMANAINMKTVWEQEDRNPRGITPTPGAWGTQFKAFKALEEFVCEMETEADNKPYLDRIVEHALKWTFEVDEGEKVLRTDGEIKNVVRSQWQGPKCVKRSWPMPPNTTQQEWSQAPGPLLLVARIKWRV